jgi:hypothetical protein
MDQWVVRNFCLAPPISVQSLFSIFLRNPDFLPVAKEYHICGMIDYTQKQAENQKFQEINAFLAVF